MPPLFAEADLPNRGITWFGPLNQPALRIILTRAEPEDGVPRKSVHIVIVATVLVGITILGIGLVVIYRLYMKKFDKDERSRQSQSKKVGVVKGPIAPKLSKNPQRTSSQSTRGNIFLRAEKQGKLMVSPDAQDKWSLRHPNSSFTVTTLSDNESKYSMAPTDLRDSAPPPLAVPSPMAWNNDLHFFPTVPRPQFVRENSRPAQESHSGPYFRVAPWDSPALLPPEKAYNMSSKGYSRKIKQTRRKEDKGTGSMSRDFRKDKSGLGDSFTHPIPFESKNRNKPKHRAKHSLLLISCQIY